MSREPERPPETGAIESTDGGLDISQGVRSGTLGSLPVGARLILRCRKDWRDAAVVSVSLESVTLSILSPTGRTYRLRRPADAAIYFDGSIPILGEGQWKTGLARYDTRW